jgi:DNA-directed RNA polymerase specialized sigma subunit
MKGLRASEAYAGKERMRSLGRRSGMEYHDLVQAGMLDVQEAIDKFDPSMGRDFGRFVNLHGLKPVAS